MAICFGTVVLSCTVGSSLYPFISPIRCLPHRLSASFSSTWFLTGFTLYALAAFISPTALEQRLPVLLFFLTLFTFLTPVTLTVSSWYLFPLKFFFFFLLTLCFSLSLEYLSVRHKVKLQHSFRFESLMDPQLQLHSWILPLFWIEFLFRKLK